VLRGKPKYDDISHDSSSLLDEFAARTGPNGVAGKASFLYSAVVFLMILVANAAPVADSQCAQGL
jgi:hypothetical protein